MLTYHSISNSWFLKTKNRQQKRPSAKSYFTVYLILIVCLLCIDTKIQAQTNAPVSTNLSNNQNYILTTTPRKAGYSPSSTGYYTNDLMQSVQYLDGLGRPIQSIQIQGSPQLNDLVQPHAYDFMGREATTYLPYSSTVNDGSFKTDALTPGAGVFAFYYPAGSTGVSGSQQANGIVLTPSPDAVKSIEPSPLDRVIEQGFAGDPWQLTGTSGLTATPGHTMKMDYSSNDQTAFSSTPGASNTGSHKVALFTTTISANQTQTLNGNGATTYGTGVLSITISKDENWNPASDGCLGTSEQYKDKLGHVVLKRTYNLKNGSLEMLSTYYVYDDMGNLAFVLPPMAGADGTAAISQATLDNYCYQYRYDERNRMTQKKMPGKGWEYIVYNYIDQPVATQDSMQRFNKQWIYTKYDAIGRPVMQGIWTYGGAAISRASLQSTLTGILTNIWESPASTGNGYTNVAWPTGSTTPLTINYYDGYTGIPSLPAYSVPAAASQMTTGLLTATQTAILNTPATTLWTTHYYDGLGRDILTYKQHYLNAVASTNNFDAITTTYNFNNQPSSITRQHWNTSSNTVPVLTIANQFIYDHMGRKLETWEQITNGNNTPNPSSRFLISKVDLNEIGQLSIKHLHSTDSTNFLQNIAYTYNERGWMLGDTSALFSERLGYNIGTNAQYNGNIAKQNWSSATSTNSFTYGYDRLNRLVRGQSGDNQFIERGVVYDQEGNINNLSRVYAGTLIDSLAFNYAGSNNIMTATDNSSYSGSTGMKNGMWNYKYDGNGNLSTDPSKGTAGITYVYNLLNLPQSVAAFNMTYVYDANGSKLRRVIGSNTTDYIDGIEYDGGVITFIQTEEGRALPNGATLYNYEYNLSDHLGDTRLTFDTGTGAVRTVQQDNYMPFGLDISVGTISSPQNFYLYNKKELQSNTQLYDYGARQYDAVVGRWTTIDPLTEKFSNNSPYIYTYDDPIKHNDPDGRSGEVTIDKENHTITVRSNLILYGSAGNGDLANKTASNIQNQWNAAGGKVSIDGQDYSVSFSVTGSYRGDITAKEIGENKDIANNYIDVVSSGIPISYMDDTGSNTGQYLLGNISGANETTSSHEMGHGWGAVAGTPDGHPVETDIRGKGQPGIMQARGTIVDSQYQWDPKAPAGAKGGTLNPEKRKVTQTDINYLNLDKLKFDKDGKADLGKLSNRYHQ